MILVEERINRLPTRGAKKIKDRGKKFSGDPPNGKWMLGYCDSLTGVDF
jgi:hypothetical protein